MTKADKTEKLSIKLTFNPDHPADAELIKALKNTKNKTAHIKLAVYHYFRIIDRLIVSNEVEGVRQMRPEIQNNGALNSGKDKKLNQWDKEAAFADAFEPLK
jgi:hypothetical protein